MVTVACAIAAYLVVSNARTWIATTTEYVRYGYVLPSTVERRTAVIDDQSISFLFVTIDDALTWRLANNPALPQSVQSWRETLGAHTVINGGYFTETNQPTGYYAIDGSANIVCPIRANDENDVPSGYTFGVWIDDGRLRFGYVNDHPEICNDSTGTVIDAFLSFPTLVHQGESLIATDSGLHARRTLLAETVDGTRYIVLTESGEVSLFDAAQWFVAQPEEFTVVGNLDGGPSTGLSMEQETWNIEIPSAVVPNVIVGTQK